MSSPSTLWIVHRDSRQRAALARISGAGDETILGAPSDGIFDSATPADIVLLAPSGDFEIELEFAHRFSARLPQCTWILLPQAGDLEETRRLFDSLPARFLRFPPQPDPLRRYIHEALHRRRADSLSKRRGRDLLASRFSRWFGGLELPDLLRTLNPALSHLPLLIRGEPGSGRGLMARYVHAFGSSDDLPLRHIPCGGIESAEALLLLMDHDEVGGPRWKRTVWLENVHLLPPWVQSRVRDWVEYGLPDGTLRSSKLRWIASANDESLIDFDGWEEDAPRLDHGLGDALSGLTLRLPPLRERPECIESFAAETAQAWSERQDGHRHRFSEAAIEELVAHPWPGNMGELESVVQRSLALTSAGVLEPHHLHFQDQASWTLPYRASPPERGEPIAQTSAPPPPSVEPPPVSAERRPTPSERMAPAFEEPTRATEAPPARPFGFDTEPSAERSRPSAPAPPSSESASRPAASPPAPPSPEDLSDEALERLLAPLNAPPAASSPTPAPPQEAASAAPASRPAPRPPEPEDGSLQRLVGALAHEVRNPLVSIRTFSELLADHFDDVEFRDRFAELVGADVRRIESVVTRLQSLSELRGGKREPVDLVLLLDRLLDEQRGPIEERSLLVLKELDRSQPYVTGDPGQIEQAFQGLIEKSLSMVPERGDVYIASKYNATGLRGEPCVRVLMRYHNPNVPRRELGSLDESIRIEGVTPAETSLDLLIAEAIVRAQDGVLTLDTTDAQETVIAVDLPAPARI